MDLSVAGESPSEDQVMGAGNGGLFANPIARRSWSMYSNDAKQCSSAEETLPTLDLPSPRSPTTLALGSQPQGSMDYLNLGQYLCDEISGQCILMT